MLFATATGASLGMLSVVGGVLLVVVLLLCAHSKKSAKLQQPDVESNEASETQGDAVKLLSMPSSPTTLNGNSPKIVEPPALDPDRNLSNNRHSKNQKGHNSVTTTRQSAKKPDKAKDPTAKRPMSEHVGGISPPFAGKLSMSTSERRLPAIPPPTGVPALVANPPDFDQTYDFIPEHLTSKDPNYQMIKDAMDPNYQRVSDAEGKKNKRNPDYEIVKGENLATNFEKLKSDPANTELTAAGKKKEELYAKVRGDEPYAEVQNSDLKQKDYDDDYAEVKCSDSYPNVNGSHTFSPTVEGAVAAVGEVQDQKDYESVDTATINGPGNQSPRDPGNHSPRPVELQENQTERLAPRAVPEVLPNEVPLVGAGNRSEPPYTQVSARESLESIRERKKKKVPTATLR